MHASSLSWALFTVEASGKVDNWSGTLHSEHSSVRLRKPRFVICFPWCGGPSSPVRRLRRLGVPIMEAGVSLYVTGVGWAVVLLDLFVVLSSVSSSCASQPRKQARLPDRTSVVSRIWCS